MCYSGLVVFAKAEKHLLHTCVCLPQPHLTMGTDIQNYRLGPASPLRSISAFQGFPTEWRSQTTNKEISGKKWNGTGKQDQDQITESPKCHGKKL